MRLSSLGIIIFLAIIGMTEGQFGIGTNLISGLVFCKYTCSCTFMQDHKALRPVLQINNICKQQLKGE